MSHERSPSKVTGREENSHRRKDRASLHFPNDEMSMDAGSKENGEKVQFHDYLHKTSFANCYIGTRVEPLTRWAPANRS